MPPAASVNGMLLAPPSPNSSVPVWPLEPSVTLVLLPNAPFVLALLIAVICSERALLHCQAAAEGVD